MPAKSQAQRAYLNARFGHDWVKKHHFDNPGKLPAHVDGHNDTGAHHFKKEQAKPKGKSILWIGGQ